MVPADESGAREAVVVHKRPEGGANVRLLLRGELAGRVGRVAVRWLVLMRVSPARPPDERVPTLPGCQSTRSEISVRNPSWQTIGLLTA